MVLTSRFRLDCRSFQHDEHLLLTSHADVAQQLTSALPLPQPPLAITFSDEPLGGTSPVTPVPAGCSFWEWASRQTLSTTASDHQHCAIGVHTHNLRDAVAEHGSELEAALGAMTGLGYVTADEVAAIPVMQDSQTYVTYGPLADTDHTPSVVLLIADGAQSLTLSEAVARVDRGLPPALGRPACALIPQVANSGAAAASLGCCGARAYVDSLSRDIVLWGLPGDKLSAYADTIETLANANATLSLFHTKRREAIETGETPTVQDSLAALGG